MKNNKAIDQDWCKSEMLITILNVECNNKNVDDFVGFKKPVKFELLKLRKTLSNFWGPIYVMDVDWKLDG